MTTIIRAVVIRAILAVLLAFGAWQGITACIWALNQPSDIVLFSGLVGLAVVAVIVLVVVPILWHWPSTKEEK